MAKKRLRYLCIFLCAPVWFQDFVWGCILVSGQIFYVPQQSNLLFIVESKWNVDSSLKSPIFTAWKSSCRHQKWTFCVNFNGICRKFQLCPCDFILMLYMGNFPSFVVSCLGMDVYTVYRYHSAYLHGGTDGLFYCSAKSRKRNGMRNIESFQLPSC